MVPKSSLLLLLFAQSQAQKLYYPGDEELSKSSSTYIQNSHSSYTNNDVTTKTITNGIVDLSLKISKEISDNHSHQNAVFSPIGISGNIKWNQLMRVGQKYQKHLKNFTSILV